MTAHSPAVDAEVQVSRRPRLVVAVLCYGGLVAALTQTMVIPIQGRLPALLHSSEANTSWVITATLLAAAVAMPISGRLGDMLGKQRVLGASTLLLIAGSATCAMAGSLVPMLAGRVLQGLAMGFIPVGISLIREITPPHLTPVAIAALSATLGVGGAIGLPLSAWVVQSYDWHALFWAATAFAVGMALATFVLVPHVHDAHPARFDIGGALGLAAGLVATLVGVSKASEWGWGSGRTLGFVCGGLVVLVGWAVYELRHGDPLCDLRVTARRPVLLTNLAAATIGFGMMGQSIAAPQLLEMPAASGYGLAQTILQAGLWMAPGGLMMMLFAPVSGGLMSRFGAKHTLVLGAVVIGAGYLVALAMMSQAWQLMLALCITSAGVGIAYAAMPTLILGNVPMEEAGSAVGINTLMRSVGTTVAGAVMATILTGATMRLGPYEVPTLGAFRWCFIAGAIATFAGALIAASIPAAPGLEVEVAQDTGLARSA